MAAYVDSRGVDTDACYSEALEKIHQMASSNVISDDDIAFGDPGLPEQRARQTEALDLLEDLVVNHSVRIDDEFDVPATAPDFPAEKLAPDASLPIAMPSEYIKVCLDMARNAATDPSSVSGIAEADECDRQQLALEVAEAFVVLHGEKLDASMASIPLPPGFLG